MTSKINSTFKITTRRLLFRFYKKSDYKEWKRAHLAVLPKKNAWDFAPIPSQDEQKLKAHFNRIIEFHRNSLKQETGYFC